MNHDGANPVLVNHSRELYIFTSNLSKESNVQKMKDGAQRIIEECMRDGGGLALLMAASVEAEMILSELLQKGAPVDYTSRTGSTALTYAAHNGNSAMCSALITKGANLNASWNTTNERNEPYAVTPLVSAALTGKRNVVQLLIESGATAATGTQTDQLVRDYVGIHLPNIMSMLNRAEHQEDIQQPPHKKRIIDRS
ncbi:MAG: ankyrin repeat domain-containing protein [Gammaproteobacteria bacterium]